MKRADLDVLLADPSRAVGLAETDLRAVLDEVEARIDQLVAVRRALYRRTFALLETTATPAPPGREEWHKVETVAGRLITSAWSVRRLIKAGKLPGSRKMGGEWRIPEAAVLAYEENPRGDAA